MKSNAPFVILLAGWWQLASVATAQQNNQPQNNQPQQQQNQPGQNLNFNQVANINGNMALNRFIFPDGSKIETFSQVQTQLIVNQNPNPLPASHVVGSTGQPFVQLSPNSMTIQTNRATDLVGAQIEMPMDPNLLRQARISPDNAFVAQLSQDRQAWIIQEPIKSVNTTDMTVRMVKMNRLDGEYMAVGRQTVETGQSLTPFGQGQANAVQIQGSGIQEVEFTDGFRMSIRASQPMTVTTDVINGVSTTMLNNGVQSINNYRYLVTTNLAGVVPNLNNMVAVMQLPVNADRLMRIAQNMGISATEAVNIGIAQRGILQNPGGAFSPSPNANGQRRRRQDPNTATPGGDQTQAPAPDANNQPAPDANNQPQTAPDANNGNNNNGQGQQGQGQDQTQNQNGQANNGGNNGNQQGQNNGNQQGQNNNGNNGQNNGNNGNGNGQQQGQNNGNNGNNNNGNNNNQPNNNNGNNNGNNNNNNGNNQGGLGGGAAATQLLLAPTFTPINGQTLLDRQNMRIAVPVGALDGEFILTMSRAGAAPAPAQGQGQGIGQGQAGIGQQGQGIQGQGVGAQGQGQLGQGNGSQRGGQGQGQLQGQGQGQLGQGQGQGQGQLQGEPQLGQGQQGAQPQQIEPQGQPQAQQQPEPQGQRPGQVQGQQPATGRPEPAAAAPKPMGTTPLNAPGAVPNPAAQPAAAPRPQEPAVPRPASGGNIPAGGFAPGVPKPMGTISPNPQGAAAPPAAPAGAPPAPKVPRQFGTPLGFAPAPQAQAAAPPQQFGVTIQMAELIAMAREQAGGPATNTLPVWEMMNSFAAQGGAERFAGFPAAPAPPTVAAFTDPVPAR